LRQVLAREHRRDRPTDRPELAVNGVAWVTSRTGLHAPINQIRISIGVSVLTQT